LVLYTETPVWRPRAMWIVTTHLAKGLSVNAASTSADPNRLRTGRDSLSPPVTKSSLLWGFLCISAKHKCLEIASTFLFPWKGLVDNTLHCVWETVVLKMTVISHRELQFWLGLMNVIFYGAKPWCTCYLPYRKCLKENEETKKQVSEKCRRHEEFLTQLHDCLDPEKKHEKALDEDFMLKVFVCRLKRSCWQVTWKPVLWLSGWQKTELLGQ
jgi:hypothetical protein